MHLSLIYMNLQSLAELQISSALNRTLSISNTASKQKVTEMKSLFQLATPVVAHRKLIFLPLSVLLWHTEIYPEKEHKYSLELFSSHHKECQLYQIQLCRQSTRARMNFDSRTNFPGVSHLRSDRRLLFFNFLLLFIPALDGDSSLAFGWLATFEEFCWLKCVGTWRASPPWDAKLALHPPTTH